MPITFRLQDLVAPSTDEVQDKQDAVDVQQYSRLTFQIRKPVAGTGTAVLTIEHAATLDDDAFVPITGATYDLTNTTTDVEEFTGTLRFIRWSVGALTSTPQFMIDVVARES